MKTVSLKDYSLTFKQWRQREYGISTKKYNILLPEEKSRLKNGYTQYKKEE